MARALKTSDPEDFNIVRADLYSFENEDRTVKRRQKLALFGELRATLTALIDPTFGERDYPNLKVRPPGKKYYQDGIAPEDIPDLQVRQEYEKMIAANAAKRERVRQQTRLPMVLRMVDADILRHCIHEYDATPAERDALRRDLAPLSNRKAVFEQAIGGALSLATESIKARMAWALESSAPEDFKDVGNAIHDFDDQDRTVKRRQKLALFGELHAALTALIDPTFGVKDYPDLNVRPPGEKYSYGNSDGMPPKDIPDLKVRKEYEKLIAANDARRERAGQQAHLPMVLRSVNQDILSHCIGEYGSTPAEQDALRQDLAPLSNHEAVFAQVTEEIRAKQEEEAAVEAKRKEANRRNAQ